MGYKTEQESFWASSFGIEYTDRNVGEEVLSANISLFSNILKRCSGVNNVIEFGSNRGLNLQALRVLLPHVKATAVEINPHAYELLSDLPNVEAINTSIIEYNSDVKYDLVIVKGVLIHISPEVLLDTYDVIYNSSKKYILICEYYNQTPVEVEYRGHKNKLFKRDFAGEMLEKYSDLDIVDYGFIYHKDGNFPMDDLTWFLLEKR